ncbi:MAG: hypothetical protein IKD83_01725 [Firmicutes bacterium]|nr:hypothetical protein [Bacillota bacterium]
MTRKKLIENIFREYEQDNEPLSKKTQKAIDKFTDTFGPETDFGENDFPHEFWAVIDAVEVDLFRLGFDTAMELKETERTDRKEKIGLVCSKKMNPGEMMHELYDYYSQTHGTDFPSGYDTIQALIDKYGREAEDFGGSIAAAYEEIGFSMGFKAAMDLRDEIDGTEHGCTNKSLQKQGA